MTTPQIRIIDGDTVIDRDMNEAELAQYELDKLDLKARQKAEKDRAKLKEETLGKLGLTADEVAALLS